MEEDIQLKRDRFLVVHEGVAVDVHLDWSVAGWGVQVASIQDPSTAATIYVGRAFVACERKEDARAAGIMAASGEVAKLLGRAAAGDPFIVRPAAIEQAGSEGNFDSAVEVVDTQGRVIARNFVNILGDGRQSRAEAVLLAREALDHVELGVDGEFIA